MFPMYGSGQNHTGGAEGVTCSWPPSGGESTGGAICAANDLSAVSSAHHLKRIVIDRARKNLDRHPNYILAAYMASGS